MQNLSSKGSLVIEQIAQVEIWSILVFLGRGRYEPPPLENYNLYVIALWYAV